MTTDLTLDQQRFLFKAAHAGTLERHPEENSNVKELIALKLLEAHPDQDPQFKLLFLTDLGRDAVSKILEDVSKGLATLPPSANPPCNSPESAADAPISLGRPLPEFNFQTYFDPAHADAMHSAVNAVFVVTGPHEGEVQLRVRQTIASLIVNLATAGERDADKLVAGCMAQLPPGIRSSDNTSITEESDLL